MHRLSGNNKYDDDLYLKQAKDLQIFTQFVAQKM